MKKNPFRNLLVLFILIIASLLQAEIFAFANEYDGYKYLIAEPKENTIKTRVDRILFNNKIRYKKLNTSLYSIPLDENRSIEEQIKELNNTGLFKTIEPDYSLEFDDRDYTSISKTATSNAENVSIEDLKSEITPNDIDFSTQYYLKQINATSAWNVSTGDNVLVAVLDSGIDGNHPDLIGKVVGLSPEDLNDNLGHGTEVAGIIAANTNNKKGIAGIGWNTKILSLKITDENNQAKVSSVVDAFERAYEQNAKIIHISLSTNQYSQVLKNAVIKAQSRGILIISTAGNTGIEEIRYPSGFEGVIGVGSISSINNLEDYSTLGEHVSLVAPGTDIFTTSLNKSYSSVTGTSFSAPQVTGIASLIWSIAPELTNTEVTEIITQGADDLGSKGKDTSFGYGLVNASKSIEKVLSQSLENDSIEIVKKFMN